MTADPAWMALARRDLDVSAGHGGPDSARVITYFRDVGHGEIRGDDSAWCAAFAGSCLERAGVRSTRSLMARSYLSWGAALAEPRTGCLVVLSRGADRRLGHVGFYAGSTNGAIDVLGGNQGHCVRISSYPRSRVLGYRWPTPEPGGSTRGDIFDFALPHVLAMEGGWSNDPADPGGPTNFGITLADYAHHKGAALTGSIAAGLEAELRSISPETVAAIYHQDYWLAARCDLLPGAAAVMHFDAAVNHGVGRAARMLQEAAQVAIDGIIGPVTLAQVRGADPLRLVARYADIRRAAYRRLRTFPRFGRGWLRRVDQTLAAAKTMAGVIITWPDPDPTQQEIAMNAEPKWWAQSLTIWGTIITGLSTVAPVLGPLVGLNVSGTLIAQFGDQITHVLEATGGVLGTVMAIAGRFRAAAPLQQTLMTFRL